MARMLKGLLLVIMTIIITIIGQGCGPKIYLNPEFSDIRAQHHVIAILPFKVTIEGSKLPKNITPEMVEKLEQDEGILFQGILYSKFLEKQQKNEYTIEFQDADQTKAILAKYSITYDNMDHYTKMEMASTLGVDAIISGTIRRSQPMSATSAIVVGALFGAWGNTNRVDVSMTIHDGNTAKLLWKYDHNASGSVGSSSEGLANSLMKNVSKKFPYKRE